MSEIGSISSGVAVKQSLTQLTISTAVMKKALETEKQMAQLLENLTKSASQASSKSGGIDIYV